MLGEQGGRKHKGGTGRVPAGREGILRKKKGSGRPFCRTEDLGKETQITVTIRQSCNGRDVEQELSGQLLN